jgi:hypothetical protein
MEKNGFPPRTEPALLQTRRKYVPPSFNSLYFRDSILSVPGYVFEKVRLPSIRYVCSEISVENRQYYGKIQEA